MSVPDDVVGLFLEGGRVVAEAIADPAVAAAWDRPSVLEDQLVSGLAGHVARGVWAVGEYLEAGPAQGPVAFGSAGEYFTVFAESASTDDHRAIRDRGAAVAAVGRDELIRRLEDWLVVLGPRLRSLEVDHLVAVLSGKVMRLEDYLTTRIVEQVVHLDDLARSIGRGPWSLPTGAQALAIAVGTDIAARRRGSDAVIRSLYRKGFAAQTLPVL